jgi:hypothetical protein
MNFSLLESSLIYMDPVTPPNSPILDQFPSFVLLAPCRLVLITISIGSCLPSTMLVWQSFRPKVQLKSLVQINYKL